MPMLLHILHLSGDICHIRYVWNIIPAVFAQFSFKPFQRFQQPGGDIAVDLNQSANLFRCRVLHGRNGVLVHKLTQRQHVHADFSWNQIVVIDLDGMVSTENAGGFNISNLGSDITNIDFGFYTPNSGDDDDNNDFAVGNCAMDYTLWAGQYNDAGTVTISSDSDFLYVTYNTNITADLGTLHIDVTSSTPDERGAPGQYFYNSDQDALFSSGTDSYTVILSLDDLGLNCDDIIYVKAHAALIGDGIGGGGDNAGETAYSGPDASGSTGETAFGGWYLSSGPGSGGSWFYYMTASVCCSTM